MKRIAQAFVLIAALIGACTFVYFMLTGPRMIDQPHIRAFQYRMPLPPAGIVTVEPDEKALPSGDRLKRTSGPLPDTKENRLQGKIYYDYYCVFCHGDSGQGNGPVGNSYMPRPADLHAPAILKLSDGELLRAMLTGPGHDPVLSRVVPARHRWHLVLYTRALGTGPAPPVEANPPQREDYRDRGLR